MDGATGLRASIDDLLRTDTSDIDASKTQDIPAFLAIRPLDYEKESKKATDMAKRSMESLLKFYLREDTIDRNEYIQLRAKIATSQLSSLIFMVKTSEHAITTLLKHIHAGSFHPRLFEVLAGLQKTLLDTMKMQTMQLIANEESFKKLRSDLENNPGTVTIEQAGNGNSARGTRDVMRQIQSEIHESFGDEDADAGGSNGDGEEDGGP